MSLMLKFDLYEVYYLLSVLKNINKTGNFYGNEFHHPTDVNNVTTNGKMNNNVLFSMMKKKRNQIKHSFRWEVQIHSNYCENSAKKENIDALEFTVISFVRQQKLYHLVVRSHFRISFCIEPKSWNTADLNDIRTKGCYKSVLNVVKFKRHLSY
ncbi:hypothetical protein V1477_016495 [Vespula maculifrons]|uniref:Uncharacterized protein n=1 Tax=Vespula maculifrons TaxID=7453 RepID=A0ABD2B9G3_VESMC